MSTSKKTPEADRSHGGPGSSHQDAEHPDKPQSERGPPPHMRKSNSHSGVSGGGGEPDSHHTHDPHGKGKGR